MSTPSYIFASNLIRSNGELAAATVIYHVRTVEPSFTYVVTRRRRTTYLFQREDRVPASVNPALNDHVRSTAVSWALVAAHADCSPEAALTLSVVRAMERWMCRLGDLPFPSADLLCLYLPNKKPLKDLPMAIKQFYFKDWHTAAARALCRHHLQR